MQHTLATALLLVAVLLCQFSQVQTCSTFEVSYWNSLLPQMTQGGTHSWYISGGTLVSGNTGVHSSSSIIQFPVTIQSKTAGRLTFEYYVSADGPNDKFTLKINGTTYLTNYDAIMWTTFSMALPYGRSVITLTYSKNSYYSWGTDSARIRLLKVEDDRCFADVICASNGVCYDEKCVCQYGWGGPDCSVKQNCTCSWNTNAFGAPRPVISTRSNSNNLMFDVSMSNHPMIPMRHFVTLYSYSSMDISNDYQSV